MMTPKFCPFCGNEPEILKSQVAQGKIQEPKVSCKVKGCPGFTIIATLEAWNRRAGDEPRPLKNGKKFSDGPQFEIPY